MHEQLERRGDARLVRVRAKVRVGVRVRVRVRVRIRDGRLLAGLHRALSLPLRLRRAGGLVRVALPRGLHLRVIRVIGRLGLRLGKVKVREG